MKFWLFIIVVVAGLLYSLKGCSKVKDQVDVLKSGHSPFGKQSTGATMGGLVPSQLSGNSPPSTTPSAIFAAPHVEFSYQFKNRTLPENPWFQEWKAAGLHVVTDATSRHAYVVGVPTTVHAFEAACEAADCIPGTCGLKVWMIYVSDLQQKGWDITAALDSILGDKISVSASPGSFILNASAGRVAAAVDVIADGSTAQVIQEPCVQLSDLNVATVESTQEYPVASSVLSNGITQTTVTFKKVGLTLDVTPTFLDRQRVELDIKQGNGVIASTVKIGNDQVPVIDTQNVSSTVTLDMGQSLVLGGVRTTKFSQSKGFLHDTVKIENGTLYVILSVTSDIPRAKPINSPVPDVFPDGLDGLLLPPKSVDVPPPPQTTKKKKK